MRIDKVIFASPRYNLNAIANHALYSHELKVAPKLPRKK